MSAPSGSRAIRKPSRRCVAAARPFACLLAIACSSGGGSGGHGGDGAGGQGQGGASGGSSGGSSSAGAAGTQGAAGSGGSAVGSGGSGVAGSAAGASGGSSGGSGATGAAGQTGSGGAAGGRGGSSGNAGGAGRGGASGAAGAGGTAGGGRGGNAGSGGAGGSAANPVTPTMNGSRYRFAWGTDAVVMEIDASVGARVATLSIGGSDIIVPQTMAAHLDGGTATDPTTWGSVFWTSPRSAWTPVTWPPPPNIDNAAYTGTISGAHAVFSGMTDTSIGVAMAKDYSVDATSGWITIGYTIKATKAQKAAPWEVSRVPRGGITFFPVPMASSVVNQVPLTISQTGSAPTIVWFDDGPKSATSPNGDKLYADGSGGWTAYVINGNLFLKKFTDIPASSQPTGEGEVDVYPGNGFLEFEVEGPYTMIAASGSVNWSIQWKVVKVPSNVSIAAGSASLVNFAMQQLAP